MDFSGAKGLKRILRMPNRRSKSLVLVPLSLMVFTACSDPKQASEANFKQVLTKFLDRPENGVCIKLPLRDKDGSEGVVVEPQEVRQSYFTYGQLHALAEASLLNEEVGEREEMTAAIGMKGPRVKVSTFSLTDAGKKALSRSARPHFKNPQLCSGKYEVVKIENFTAPADMMGRTVSQVRYQLKALNVADWMKNPQVIAAFPELNKKVGDAVDASAVLVLTNNGWLHEWDFK